jgi:hypothetical protein
MESSTKPICSGYTSGLEGAIVLRRRRRHMRQTVRVADAFPIVIIGVSIVAIVVAVIVAVSSGGLYDRIGRGGTFGLDTDATRPSGPPPGSPAARAEADEEIRQLIEAKSARRVARGEAPLDVEAEIAALSRPAAPAGVDEELREEVRQLVVARNERRMARGQEPLDVEAEVNRQLRDLGA